MSGEWLRKSDLDAFAAEPSSASKLWTFLVMAIPSGIKRDGHDAYEVRAIAPPHRPWNYETPRSNSPVEGVEISRTGLLYAYEQRHIYGGIVQRYGPTLHQLFVNWMKHLK